VPDEDAGTSCDVDVAVAPGPTPFSLPCAGLYRLRGLVRAPSDGTNSFFVDIDQESTGAQAKIWDLDVTATFEEQDVSWRGEGCAAETCAELDPKTWSLTEGGHTLYLGEREPGTEIPADAVHPHGGRRSAPRG